MRIHTKRIRQMLIICFGLLILLTAKQETVQAASMKISKLTVSAPKTGSTYASGSVTYATSSCKNLKLRVRVLNSKGKYVYQKTLSSLPKSGTKLITWNGKASSGNTAKVKKNTIVADGTYRLEVCLSGKKGKKNSSVTKKSTFKITRTVKTEQPIQPSITETAGSSDTTLPGTARLTGDIEIDYMAEMMLQAAGVTEGMSADEKVQKIYYWISHEFKHVHDLYLNYPNHYDLTSLAPQISEYKAKVDAMVREGRASYVRLTYCEGVKLDPAAYTDARFIGAQNRAKLWFNAQVGQCNRTADAFMILCNHAGIEAGNCAGYYLNSNGTRSGHNWNWARIGQTVYYYDVDVQLQNNARGFKYPFYERWYKADKAMAVKHHLFTHGMQD